MTTLLREAVERYLESEGRSVDQTPGPLSIPTQQEGDHP
jgi:hypothetical protein